MPPINDPVPPRRGGASFPKRFFKIASAEPVASGFALLLDGKGARTPGRNPLVLPTAGLAEVLAREWNALGETIDPREMPLTRLANSVIDGVRETQDAVMAETARFAFSDLVAYRAGDPMRLVEAQAEAWDPIVAWSRDHLRAPLKVSEGVTYVAQPDVSVTRLQDALAGFVGRDEAAPFRLGALHVVTTLTGSLLLALAFAAGRVSVAEAWSAAHVDEDYQISEWGSDAEAEARRALREREMRAAAMVYDLTRSA